VRRAESVVDVNVAELRQRRAKLLHVFRIRFDLQPARRLDHITKSSGKRPRSLYVIHYILSLAYAVNSAQRLSGGIGSGVKSWQTTFKLVHWAVVYIELSLSPTQKTIALPVGRSGPRSNTVHRCLGHASHYLKRYLDRICPFSKIHGHYQWTDGQTDRMNTRSQPVPTGRLRYI